MLCFWFLGNISAFALTEVQMNREMSPGKKIADGEISAVHCLTSPGCHIRIGQGFHSFHFDVKLLTKFVSACLSMKCTCLIICQARLRSQKDYYSRLINIPRQLSREKPKWYSRRGFSLDFLWHAYKHDSLKKAGLATMTGKWCGQPGRHLIHVTVVLGAFIIKDT